MSLNDWIKLDVSGRIIKTTRSTLVACPGSKLANMFSLESSWPADAISPDGDFKIDADPNVFEILLNWLRYKKLMMTHGISLESVAVVAEDFGLIDMQHAVEEHKKTFRVFGLNDNKEKSIIEEMGEVLNFLKNDQIQNEDLNVIKKHWDDLQSSLKYIPNGKHFNILPTEIKMNILSYLKDLDALHAASVCEEWEGMLKSLWGMECLVCLETMEPATKIWACPNSHAVCEPCKANLIHQKGGPHPPCPTCKTERVNQRALIVEKIAASLFHKNK